MGNAVRWNKRLEAKDFDGASSYLTLLFPPTKTKKLIAALRRASPIEFTAKDLLRASQLPQLSKDDPHVANDLKQIHKGKSLPPVMLIRGDASISAPMIIADGYHRICAICYFDEDEPVACLLASRK